MFQRPTLPGSLHSLSFAATLPVAEIMPQSPGATADPVPAPVTAPSPASQGTVWTIQRIAREFAAWADARNLPVSADEQQPGRREFIELGLACLVFSKPRECWNKLETSGGLENLIGDAEDIVWEMPIDRQLEMQRHFTAELARINRLKHTAAQA